MQSDRTDTDSPCSENATVEYRPLMFAGTGSDVGKSVIAAGVCRILRQDGLNPAPFKAQNMALNSYVTPDGLEIGRAQAMQAQAAGIECEVDMNPILLKPQGDGHSQVVILGKPEGSTSAYSYFRKEGRERWREVVHRAYDRLSRRFSPIILEGAGSIAEINLKEVDIVNMPMARYADAAVILVADIDRGGVFASVYGSIMLQSPEDRKRIKGVIINKFRGDIRLFESGVKLIEELCGVPVLGVIPYLNDMKLEAEDSLALSAKKTHASKGVVNIAVVRLPHISNFTDFDVLESIEGINVYYTLDHKELSEADIIIIPGTKTTIDDLHEIRKLQLDRTICNVSEKGKVVIGICGGYQMLGKEIYDPLGIEGEKGRRVEGLGLLPVSTTMEAEKRTKRVSARFCGKQDFGMEAYEIHMGNTSIDRGVAYPLFETKEKKGNGRIDNEGVRAANCMGTYLHGILDNREFIELVLSGIGKEMTVNGDTLCREREYDRLAGHLRKYINMPLLYTILRGNNVETGRL